VDRQAFKVTRVKKDYIIMAFKKPAYLTDEEYAKCLLLEIEIHRGGEHPKRYYVTNPKGEVLREKRANWVGNWVECETPAEALDAVSRLNEHDYIWR
jgi:hypothetical protein